MSINFGPLEHTMSFGVAGAGAHTLAAALLLVAGIYTAPAQPRPASAAIDAVVTDTSLTPLADATAWVFGSNIQVSTGANGRFQILGIPAGQYMLLVRRLGSDGPTVRRLVAENQEPWLVMLPLDPVYCRVGYDGRVVALH